MPAKWQLSTKWSVGHLGGGAAEVLCVKRMKAAFLSGNIFHWE